MSITVCRCMHVGSIVVLLTSPQTTDEEEEDLKDDFELPPPWVLPIEVSARGGWRPHVSHVTM